MYTHTPRQPPPPRFMFLSPVYVHMPFITISACTRALPCVCRQFTFMWRGFSIGTRIYLFTSKLILRMHPYLIRSSNISQTPKCLPPTLKNHTRAQTNRWISKPCADPSIGTGNIILKDKNSYRRLRHLPS